MELTVSDMARQCRHIQRGTDVAFHVVIAPCDNFVHCLFQTSQIVKHLQRRRNLGLILNGQEQIEVASTNQFEMRAISQWFSNAQFTSVHRKYRISSLFSCSLQIEFSLKP